jgi:hypothetical protein
LRSRAALALVTAVDELEQEIGVTVGIGEISDLIDGEEVGVGIVAQTPTQRGIAVERGEITEQLSGADEQHGVAIGQRGWAMLRASVDLPTPLGPTRMTFLEEVERHQGVEGGAVATFGSGPIEVAYRLKAADMSSAEPMFQAATNALLLLPV